MTTANPTLENYHCDTFSHGKRTRAGYRRSTGPAVIIIHEMPGLHPLVIRFADRVAAAGLSVYLPSLFGTPGRAVSNGYVAREMLKAICIRREFSLWSANRSSPIVDWLRALARHAHAACGGAGVGALGMCFTGGFALAMMTEPSVIAPVLSQPSLPLAFGAGSKKRAGAIDATGEELRCARSRLKAAERTALALRFEGDPFVPPERFAFLKAQLGEQIETRELPAASAGDAYPPPAHSVLTLHLDDRDPDGPTRRLEREVIAYFRSQLTTAEDSA